MNEKDIKTSPKQRFFIVLIAVLMVGSIVASYAAIIVSGSSSSSSSTTSEISDEKLAEYAEDYAEEVAKFSEATQSDFNEFIKYKSEITAYNETEANSSGVKTKDVKEGSGDTVTEDNYLAYYVGWCADESVFDSSFDDDDNPTAFAKILDPSLGMIEGWTVGVEGMKLGGIRVITVPGELAYGDSMEICGGTNKPLKFLVMAVKNTDELSALSDELDEAYLRYQYAQYGIDYDAAAASVETE
jgi:FKBP-type peptidyl-prolyl cis-trans isomerase